MNQASGGRIGRLLTFNSTNKTKQNKTKQNKPKQSKQENEKALLEGIQKEIERVGEGVGKRLVGIGKLVGEGGRGIGRGGGGRGGWGGGVMEGGCLNERVLGRVVRTFLQLSPEECENWFNEVNFIFLS